MRDAPQLVHAAGIGHAELVAPEIGEMPGRVHRGADEIERFRLAPKVLPGGRKCPQQPMRIGMRGMMRIELSHAVADPAQLVAQIVDVEFLPVDVGRVILPALVPLRRVELDVGKALQRAEPSRVQLIDRAVSPLATTGRSGPSSAA